jgi:hypothetical protein
MFCLPASEPSTSRRPNTYVPFQKRIDGRCPSHARTWTMSRDGCRILAHRLRSEARWDARVGHLRLRSRAHIRDESSTTGMEKRVDGLLTRGCAERASGARGFRRRRAARAREHDRSDQRSNHTVTPCRPPSAAARAGQFVEHASTACRLLHRSRNTATWDSR